MIFAEVYFLDFVYGFHHRDFPEEAKLRVHDFPPKDNY
jgi:hypothetical protein